MSEKESVIKNYQNLKEEIGQQAKIMAVSKTISADSIVPLLESGHLLFGENRVMEAEEKWLPLKAKYPQVKLHLIGHLQKNKIKEALSIFDSIDTLDSYALVDKIAEYEPTNKTFMIEINTGSEPQKSGILPEEADDFIRYCINEKKLNVTGLICIPPQDQEPSPHFAFLKMLARRHNLQELSMGMSHDYMLGIGQGATIVRIGTGIFGAR